MVAAPDPSKSERPPRLERGETLGTLGRDTLGNVPSNVPTVVPGCFSALNCLRTAHVCGGHWLKRCGRIH